jgi:DNA-binding LacI/PurR family transcriptional regulator
MASVHVGPAGSSVRIANTHNEPARETRQVAELRAHQAEGMVVVTARVEDQVLEEFTAVGTPVVHSSLSTEWAAGWRRPV